MSDRMSDRMRDHLKRVCRLLLAACSAWAFTLAGFAGEDPVIQEDGDLTDPSVKSALEERLRALEDEDKVLERMASKVESGEQVKVADLLSTWLPPAVYLIDNKLPFENLEMTQAAAEITTGLLLSKESEGTRLLELKKKIERGETFDLAELDHAASLGLDNRKNLLQEYEAEVEALRAKLETLHFQERFINAAKVKKKAGDAPRPPPAVIEEEEPVVEIASVDENEGAPEPAGTPIAVDLMALGKTYFRAGKYQKAQEVYARIDIATHPQGDRILFMIGRCRESQGDLEQALKNYQQVTKEFPGSFWAKQAKFAMEIVEWKQELGSIEGVPSEVRDLLGRSRVALQDGGSK